MSAINAEVKKNPNENAISLIRRFSRRVKGSGVLKKAREFRFYNRELSEAGKKTQTLKRLRRAEEREHLKKLGKIPS